jgi:hypothetical protein
MLKASRDLRSFEEAEQADREFDGELTPQALSKDSSEFIGLLNSQGIEYLIVRAHSVVFSLLTDNYPVNSDASPS